MNNLQSTIDAAWEGRAELTPQSASPALRQAVEAVIAELDAGRLRVAEKLDGRWTTHQWLKKALLLFFRLRDSAPMDIATGAYDKVPLKFAGWGENRFREAGFRAVPGSVVRHSAYIAPG